jgi:hypothetical protein
MKCTECQCTPLECTQFDCYVCTKEICCCTNRKRHSVYRFFKNVRNMYATALAIEVLCICAAEIGENSSFLMFGYKTVIGRPYPRICARILKVLL